VTARKVELGRLARVGNASATVLEARSGGIRLGT
jgi:hypothetical protein